MSERGVFAVDRGIFDHPSVAGEKYTKVQALMWLISEAAWKPHKRTIGSVQVEVQRGQVACSLRFMAQRWRWEEPRVRRFLGRLKTDAVIDTATDAGVTVITLCNYDSYQRVSLPTDAPADAPIDAETTQHRRKLEDKENKEDLSAGKPAKRIEQHLDKFAEFARAYPRKHVSFPTTMARKRWVEAMKRGENPEDILAGAKAYAREQAAANNIGSKYIKGADSWLCQQAWKDFVGQQPAAAPTLFGTGPAQLGSDPLANVSPDRWRTEVRNWKKTGGHWPFQRLGCAPPDAPNTKVPRAILAEFGLAPRSAIAA